MDVHRTAQWQAVKKLVHKRDGYTCAGCGRNRWADEIHIQVDHVVRDQGQLCPLARAGLRVLETTHRHLTPTGVRPDIRFGVRSVLPRTYVRTYVELLT